MLDLLFLFILSNKHVSRKVHVTQPIEWLLEKPEQPIREAGIFDILRAI